MVVLSPEVQAAVDGTGLTRTLPARMVQAMNLPSWIIVTLGLLIQAQPSWSADSAVMEQRRSYLLSGMVAEREKIRSGHVVITGEHSSSSSDTEEFRFPVRYEIYFDRTASKYRYSQLDYIRVSRSAGKAKRAKAPKLSPIDKTIEEEAGKTVEIGGTVVHTPEYDLHRPIDSTTVSRLGSGAATGTAIREWDVRAFGLLDWFSFARSSNLDSALHGLGVRTKCHSVEIGPSGYSVVKVRSDDYEWEIWVDESQGMTPIRLSRTELSGDMRVTSTSDVSWSLINGVWVPASIQISGTTVNSGTQEKYELKLDWSHVNEPLDPQVFTPKGITNDSALVADIRLGPVLLERVVPRPLPVVPPIPAQPKPNPKTPLPFGWIVLANLVAGGGVASWYYRRKSRRPST